MGKGEIARYKQFLLFPQCFQKGLFPRGVKRCHCVGMGWLCFQQYFSHILEFFWPVLRTIFSPRQKLLSHITIVETMYSGERGMNPVAMTIINPRGAKNVRAWDQNSGLLFSSPACYQLSYGAWQWHSNLTRSTKEKWFYFLSRCSMNLTLSQTRPGFYVSAVQVFWKHCGKRRNCS